MKKLALLLPVILLGACASNSLIVKNSATIRAGMSVNKLRELMGDPQNRQFDGSNEAWQYCATGLNSDQYVLVWMQNEVVTGMQTYKNTVYGGMCDEFFKTIDWEEAPDTSIEIRNR